MRIIFLLTFLLVVPLALLGKQPRIEITVQDARDGSPLQGATIVHGYANYKTDEMGKAKLLPGSEDDFILVTFTGYERKRVTFGELTKSPMVRLEIEENVLSEITISTGYYTAPKERTTGAFTVIDEELINRSMEGDILSRMDGVTSSLQLDNRLEFAEAPEGEPELRIRGLSTIHSSTKPLIVLNGFPFDGDLDLINPDDIESVTISKDAAAASIWGARAANGVMVITTKKGTASEKPDLAFNSSVVVGGKPDLFYYRNFLPSKDIIEVEKTLFDRGYYLENEFMPLSPVVELLIDEREGRISSTELDSKLDKLGQRDVRQGALEHLYQNSVKQRYGLRLTGGADFFTYYFSAGYDRGRENTVRDRDNKINVSFDNRFNLSKNIDFGSNVSFSQQTTMDNGLGFYMMTTRNSNHYYPYMKFKDEQGVLPAAPEYRQSYIDEAEKNGLLNWEYYPLDELELNNNQTRLRYFNLSADLKWKIAEGLNLGVLYNYQLYGTKSERLHDEESYYARNLINRFTQDDGTRIFPEGAVLWRDVEENNVHTGRTQLNYNRLLGIKHSINALAGTEVRQTKMQTGPATQLAGYDVNTLAYDPSLDYKTRFRTKPYGFTSVLPAGSSRMNELTDRYISYYANVAYGYDNRLYFSGSVRWDASNLFGVNTNQKGVPLWSIGGKWHAHQEEFFNSKVISRLSFRATYGYNGNVNKSATAYPIVQYIYDSSLGVNTARLQGVGNPGLRWEKTGVTNFGVDVTIKDNLILATVDLYRKKSTDLLGHDILDPTSGISGYGGTNLSHLVNYADMLTQGIDVELTSRNINARVKWFSHLLFNYSVNKITKYNSNESASMIPYLRDAVTPAKEGMSRDALYSLPWNGLSHENGYQNVIVDGEESQDYGAYMATVQYEDLIYHGPSVPPLFGSLRNTFEMGNFDLSFNIQWKFGHYFRRSSILYSYLFNDLTGHRDYLDRWIKPGDEDFTTVPAMPESNVPSRDNVYRYSEVLVEKGDHIRLQDIQAGYRLDGGKLKGAFKSIYLQLYVRNLGILWRANGQGLDPESPISPYPRIRTYGIGLKLNL